MGRMYTSVTFLVLALGVFLAPTAAQDQPTVTIQEGVLVGTTETFQESQFIGVNKTIDVFRGIPFAEPPVGRLRFKPPVAKEPWVDTYDATYFRDACVQDPSQLYGATMSEDCLHLNIYAPRPAVPGGAAVMVWIHGGGYVSGSAVLTTYWGQPLAASGDVIVVTINYRLSAFGFLTTGDEALPGNVGLMDQTMALKWIKENIAAFGGDSNRITIFGESAGSASVNFHMLSEHSRGLFNRAILQSGTVFSPWAFSEEKEALRSLAFRLGESLGCVTSESMELVNCLRDKTATDIFGAIDLANSLYTVVVDGSFLVDTPTSLYLTGRYNHVDVLLGTNKDEGTVLFSSFNPAYANYATSPVAPTLNRREFDEVIANELSIFMAGNTEQLQAAIKMRYIDWSQADYIDHDFFPSYVEYSTDVQFACGTDGVARVHSYGGDNVFLYQMTHAPSVSLINLSTGLRQPWLGSTHAEDISFVFGCPFIPELSALYADFTDEERALAVQFMKFWTTFAKTGNPGTSQSGRDFWPRFTIPELGYKELSLNLTTSRALKSDKCHFWTSYVVQLNTMLADLDVAEREWREAFHTWKYTDLADWRYQFAEYKAINAK